MSSDSLSPARAAVAIGVVYAAELARELGRIDAARVDEHRRPSGNFLGGTVRTRHDNRSGIAQTAFGSISINMLSVPALGEAIQLLIRPEDFSTVPASTHGSDPAHKPLAIPARVHNVMYFGEHYEADAVVGEQRLRFKSNSAQAPESDMVTLTLKQTTCWAFAGKVIA